VDSGGQSFLFDDQTFQPFLKFTLDTLALPNFQFDLDQKYGKIELLHHDAGACTSSLNLPVVEHLLCELNNRVLCNGLEEYRPG
jgi:hypothetical protein